MTAQPTETERENSRKAGRFEEQDNDEHCNRRISAGRHGCDGEDDTHRQVHAQDITRLEGWDHEEEARQESVEGIHTLAHGEHIGTEGRAAACLFDKVDKVVGHADLAANVAELAPDGEEEVDLAFEGADVVVTDGVFLNAPILWKKRKHVINSIVYIDKGDVSEWRSRHTCLRR